jgi:hypothetical protein
MNILTALPDLAASCVAYLDADLSNLFSDAGATVPSVVDGNVRHWRDLSGTSHHFSRAADSLNPILRTETLGLETIRAIEFASQAHLTNLSAFLQAFTAGEIYIVAKSTTGAGGLIKIGNSGDSMRYKLSGEVLDFFGSAVRRAPGVDAADITIRHTYAVATENDRWRQWLNGSQFYEDAVNAVAFGNGTYYLGSGNGALSIVYTGRMYAVLMFNAALSAVNRAALDSYCRARWTDIPVGANIPHYPSLRVDDMAVSVKRTFGYALRTIQQPSTNRSIMIDNSGNETVIQIAGTFYGPEHGSSTFDAENQSLVVDGQGENEFPEAGYIGEDSIAFTIQLAIGPSGDRAYRVIDRMIIKDKTIYGTTSFLGLDAAQTVSIFYAKQCAREARYSKWAAYSRTGVSLGSGEITGSGSGVTNMPAGTAILLQYDSAQQEGISYRVWNVDHSRTTWSIDNSGSYRKARMRHADLESSADKELSLGWGQLTFALASGSWPPTNPADYTVAVPRAAVGGAGVSGVSPIKRRSA